MTDTYQGGSRPRGLIILQSAVVIACLYGFLIGGVFTGILDSATSLLSMAVLSVCIGGWELERRFRRRRWTPTALDGIALAWGIAILIAWAANGVLSRRSSIGAWYDAVALLLILISADLIRRGMPRRWLFDAALIGGLYALWRGIQDMTYWLSGWQRIAAVGVPLLPIRPSGVFGNPNSFGTVLIVLITLAAARIFTSPHLSGKLFWIVYSVLAGALLIVTQSKGAWIGLAVGLFSMALIGWRYAGIRLTRRQVIGSVGAAFVGGIIFILLGIPLLQASARGDGRLGIYTVAIHAFLTSPFTGHGPDSFSLQLMLNQSIPPQPPHAHAHDMILHVAAELGIFGLIAIGVMIVLGARSYFSNLAGTVGRERTALIGVGGALIAYAGHGLFDVTPTQPAILLLGAMLFAAAVAPAVSGSADPQSATSARLRVSPILISSLITLIIIVILIGGWVSTLIFAIDLAPGLATAAANDYTQAASKLQAAAQIDPQSAAVWAAAGFAQADSSNATQAIADYEQAIRLEPPNALNWLNLMTLYDQVGRTDDALRASAQAIRYAPDDAPTAINRGLLLEKYGQKDAARALYQAALTRAPTLAADPLWDQTPFRQQIARPFVISRPSLLTLLNAGKVDAARSVITAERNTLPERSQPYVDAALFEIRTHGNLQRADQDLTAALILYAPFLDSAAWIHYAQGELDAARGDLTGRARERDLARHDVTWNMDGTALAFGGNVTIATYFTPSLPRTQLPQVWYPHMPAEVKRLLALPASF